MSLRSLPEIKAFDGPSALSFEPDPAVLAKWSPGIRAARDESDNVISIYDVIGQDFWTGEGVTTKRVAAALRAIGGRDVVVNINSPGGDVFEGNGIYSLLKDHPHKVTVKVMGMAASAASVIAMAGDDIRISDVGFMFVHNTWSIGIGNRHDFREFADTLEPFDDAMASLYAARSGQPKKAAAAWMDAETWFNADQAIEAGLADGKLDSTEITEGGTKATKALAAARQIETALRRQGMSAREAKTLITEFRGARDAAPHAARDAGDITAQDLRGLIATLS